jgi:hypothetical protein
MPTVTEYSQCNVLTTYLSFIEKGKRAILRKQRSEKKAREIFEEFCNPKEKGSEVFVVSKNKKTPTKISYIGDYMLRIGNIKKLQDSVNGMLSQDTDSESYPTTSYVSIQKTYKLKNEDLRKRAEYLENRVMLVANELYFILNENPQLEIVKTGKGHVIKLPLTSENDSILNEKEEELHTSVFDLEQESNQLLLQMEKAYALIAINDKRLSRIRNKLL